jgi:hypothetical protein
MKVTIFWIAVIVVYIAAWYLAGKMVRLWENDL